MSNSRSAGETMTAGRALSRRALLQTAVATALALPALSACRGSNSGTPRGIAVMGKTIDDITNGFDPAEAYDDTNCEVIGSLYRTLVRYREADSGHASGDLAQAWEVSQDGRRLTFHLGSDSRFASGAPVTAEDAAFSLQRVILLNKDPAFLLSQFGWTADNVHADICAEGPSTLIMKLPQVQAPGIVLSCLASSCGAVIEKAVVLAHEVHGDLGNHWLRSHSAGSGPYRLVEWLAGDRIILDSNPHAAVMPGVPRLIVSHVADSDMQLVLLNKGDIDMARNLGSDQLTLLQGRRDVTLLATDSLDVLILAANQAVPQFKHPEVLQAIKWAVDYQAIARNITPQLWNVWQSLLPRGTPGAVAEVPFRKDLSRARRLMAAAGLEHGFEVTLDHFSGWPYAEIAEALQADLAAIGIRVQLLSGEQGQVTTKSRGRHHQLALLRFECDYLDPHSAAQWGCANPDDSDSAELRTLAWRSHFQDTGLNAAVAAAARELDESRRMALYDQIQHDFWQRAPLAILLQRENVSVCRSGVTGLRIGAVESYTNYQGVTKS